MDARRLESVLPADWRGAHFRISVRYAPQMHRVADENSI
jgi:hypothetical protein